MSLTCIEFSVFLFSSLSSSPGLGHLGLLRISGILSQIGSIFDSAWSPLLETITIEFSGPFHCILRCSVSNLIFFCSKKHFSCVVSGLVLCGIRPKEYFRCGSKHGNSRGQEKRAMFQPCVEACLGGEGGRLRVGREPFDDASHGRAGVLLVPMVHVDSVLERFRSLLRCSMSPICGPRHLKPPTRYHTWRSLAPSVTLCCTIVRGPLLHRP